MKRFQQMLKLFLVMALVGMSVVFGQTTGKLTGRVTDAQSGDYLPGANVMLEGTSIGGATDREGSFRIMNVPAGNYTLIARYIGYNDYTAEVVVDGGGVTNHDVGMSVGYIEMGDVVVEGIRQGQVKALSMQRNADNIKNVISREQMEAFPDLNVAEIIQRLPGVTIDRSGGDGRYVLIRGTEPRLSTITVNGAALATSRVEERYSQLDIMGSNQMSFVEVVKAITPDMDANSIGGNINVTTRSAFDNPGRKLNATLGSGYTGLDGKIMGQAKVNYSDFLMDGKLGYNLTANWDRKERGADNGEYGWGSQDDVADNEIEYALEELNQMDFQMTKTRIGVGGGLEFRPSPGNRFYTNIMWNKFSDDASRGRMRLRVDKGDYLNAAGTLTEDSRIIREHKHRVEDLFQSHYSFGGEHELGSNKLDYMVAYSAALEEHKPQLESEWDFSEKVNLDIDFSEGLYPKWDIVNTGFDGAALYLDATQYEFGSFDHRNTEASNTQTVAGINYEMPMRVAGYPSTVKVGGKYTSVFKNRDDTRTGYDWDGDIDITMDMWESDRTRDDFMNDNYTFGPQVDAETAQDFLDDNMADFEGEVDSWDSFGQAYEVDESVIAGYAMANVDLGDFNIIGGLRYEMTSNDLKGTNLIFDDEGDYLSHEPIDQDKKYNNIFPMFHVTHDFSANTKFRLAYTSTMSRPHYWDLAPYFYVRGGNEEIRSGNKDLVPTMASNIDFMAEHYLSGVGLISGSFFYKSLKDIIFEKTWVLTADEHQGLYTGWDMEQSVNGGDATLYGCELNWQQELTFLPGALSGLGVYVNYTHTWAKTDWAEYETASEGVSARAEEEETLPGQAGDAANLAVSYEAGRFSGRLSWAYQGPFITAVGKDEGHDEWMASHAQLDFTGNIKVTEGLDVFVDLVNLTNAPEWEYMGIEDRPIKVEFYSWTSRFGLKYRF